MSGNVKSWTNNALKSLFELKKTERLWHIPVLASLCAGIPLLIGLYYNKLNYGILSCTAGLVILYLPSTSVANRMITLLACSFGFMVSFAIGVVFSFNPYISSLVFGLFAFSVHWVTNYFKMKPPGSFFFIMIASIASCMPFDLLTIPTKVGLVGMGSMLACILAFFYSLYIVKKHPPKNDTIVIRKSKYASIIESALTGIFLGGSLLLGHLLKMDNPYWVPISCAAVMQGVTLHHVWQRSFQRILGTFIGLGLARLLLQLHLTPLSICICIFVLQFIIEMLVVRHYGLAVIFITPMTIFLAEAGSALSVNPDTLIGARFLDIALGSIVGAIGGWFVHHEQLRHKAEQRIRKTRVAFLRRG